MVKSACLGLPRIGQQNELKDALELFWDGKITEDALKKVGFDIRKQNWQLQKSFNIDYIPSNDFSFYDHVLDCTVMTGNIPRRYYWEGGKVPMEIYFSMARGQQKEKFDVSAMEISRWFNTNYHYVSPEFDLNNQDFLYSDNKAVLEFLEARQQKVETRVALLGPLTYLKLGRIQKAEEDEEEVTLPDLMQELLPVYNEVIQNLKRVKVTDIQIEESILTKDLHSSECKLLQDSYKSLREAAGNSIKIHLITSYDSILHYKDLVYSLPINSIHIDLQSKQDLLDQYLTSVPKHISLSLGLVNAQNIWINNLDLSIKTARKAVEALGSDRVIIAPSSSLIHCPIDLSQEKEIPPEIKATLAFAKQKLHEVNVIKTALNNGESSVKAELSQNKKIVNEMLENSRNLYAKTKLSIKQLERNKPHSERCILQRNAIKLPALPITLIGSMPQDQDIEDVRSDKTNKISAKAYKDLLKEKVKESVLFQERLGVDVLTNGELERTNSVEHFAQNMAGLLTTEFGLIQSLGNHVYKPPIIFGDIKRKGQITVAGFEMLKSCTKKPVKASILGPITFVSSCFFRENHKMKDICRQVAIILSEEVKDLEKAGAKIIEVEESGFAQQTPLKTDGWPQYFTWAIECFKIATSAVQDSTQIQTCISYARCENIVEEIIKLDSDVLLLEACRSQMHIMETMSSLKYPNEIGLGLYDTLSPRIPTKQELKVAIQKLTRIFEIQQIWITPDSNLKARKTEEARKALVNLFEATKEVRQILKNNV